MSKKPKKQGRTITVSPEAHEALSREAFDHKPRLTLRELLNIKTKINQNA